MTGLQRAEGGKRQEMGLGAGEAARRAPPGSDSAGTRGLSTPFARLPQRPESKRADNVFHCVHTGIPGIEGSAPDHCNKASCNLCAGGGSRVRFVKHVTSVKHSETRRRKNTKNRRSACEGS